MMPWLSIGAFVGAALGVQALFVALTLMLARARGVFVPAASIGLGPALLARPVGPTEVRLGLVPLGAYATLEGSEPEPPLPDGLRRFESLAGPDKALIYLGPWGLMALALALVGDPAALALACSTWVLGALSPLSEGAEAVRAAWDYVRQAPAGSVALGTATYVVAANLLPFPTLAVGQTLLLAVPEARRDVVRLVGLVAQLPWTLGWVVAVVTAGLR